ncbi:MAG TPA: VOC family protein [Opitutaceae bacterium]|nr:VOC family protein [Opitutaceae bacterium]
MAITLEKIRQIALVFKRLDAAVSFYRDTLGLKFLFQAGPNIAFFDCSGTWLIFTTPEKPEFDHPNNILYFNVADIQAAHVELAGKGLKFEEVPRVIAKMEAYDLWMAFFRDEENNLLALRSEVKPTP